MLVVAGPSSEQLAREVASLLGWGLVGIEHKLFPDGESYLRFTKRIEGEEVALVQSITPPQDRSLLQLLFLLRTARELGARKVWAIVPYLAYARQDERYREGEVVSGKLLIDMLNELELDALVTFDVHNPELLKGVKARTIDLSAMPLIAEYFSKLLRNPFVLAPDQEAPERAEVVASILGCEWSWLIKSRDKITGEIETKPQKKFDASGKEVLIVDDIISTGGTVMAAAKIARELGAREVHAACTHPILAGDALRRLREAGIKRVVGTNSIPSQVSEISLAPEICKVLREL